MSKNEFSLLRKRVIECVLATDMSQHSKLYATIKARLSLYEEANKDFDLNYLIDNHKNLNLFEIQQDFMNYSLHASDISHACKPWDLELKWTELIFKEFFNQGDLEKSMDLPVSFLCNRDTTNIAKSQIGFIQQIIEPTFSVLCFFLPKINNFMKNIQKNLNIWKDLDRKETEKKNNIENIVSKENDET